MIVNGMTVVGCGGIGVHFIRPAVSLLPKNILVQIIDGDIYETKNLMRQLIPAHIVTMRKASYWTQIVKEMGHPCHGLTTYIHDDEAFAALLANGSTVRQETHGKDSVYIVALCVDNDATRRIVYDAVRMTKVPTIVIDMANETDVGDVILWGWDGENDIGPFPPKMYPNIANPKDRPPGASCAQQVESGNTQIIPTNMMAACLGVHALYSILNDKGMASQTMFDWNKSRVVWRM